MLKKKKIKEKKQRELIRESRAIAYVFVFIEGNARIVLSRQAFNANATQCKRIVRLYKFCCCCFENIFFLLCFHYGTDLNFE